MRLRLTIRRMILAKDHDQDPGDCECTFFWANLDRGDRREWIRLSDYSTKSMHDYDDRRGAGDGVRKFEGARWDFWIREDQSFTLRANGYDQDCLDGLFGTLYLDDKRYIRCKATTDDNDRFPEFKFTFSPPYGRATASGVTVMPTNKEYAFEIHVQKLRTIR
jgi:hypothetical protein